MLTEPIAVTLLVVDALEAIGVRYAIGGSLASAFHGVMRATLDADFVAELHLEHAPLLVRMLREAFYVDEPMIRSAIQRHASFNVVHLETMFKVDVFVAGSRALDRAQLDRRQLQRLSDAPERHAYVITAEDIVLAKLEWYRLSNEVSERQWRDILGVLKVQSSDLDSGYLRRMAAEMDICDLLERALQDAL